MEISTIVFCWNLQSVQYSLSNIIPDFIEDLTVKFKEFDIVIIALQEDSIRDSELTDLIDKHLGYIKIESVELSGWGSTTYKALKRMEYLPRGLRLTVFKRSSLALSITADVSSYLCPSIRDRITWGKGAVAINLYIENFGDITISNFHLPFDSKGLRDSSIRKENMKWQATCFEYLYKNIKKSDNLIIAGDFNFRVDLTSQTVLECLNDKEKLQRIYNHNDELRRCMDFALIPHLNEGVDNIGPIFNPTCKLFQNRESLSYNTGKWGQRTPSWCDRILYSTPKDLVIECVKYYRYDEGNMNLSDHAAVIGEYMIRK